jgi:tetratricopeptide (TPR) repeat protein
MSALDGDAAEIAVLQSTEYQEVERASLKATAAAYGNSIGRYEQTDWGKALNAAKALVAKYPDSSFAYAKLASIYKQMGFSDEAIAAYQHALKLKPDDAESWDSLGRIYKESGKITQADFAFSQAIAYQQKTVERRRSEGFKSPSGNMPLYALGDIYHSAGNDEAAKGCFLQAMQEDPKSMAALMSSGPLQDIYLSEGNEKPAFDLAYQMMLDNPRLRVYGATSPPEAEAWAELGDWYSKHGREADELRCFENAVRLGLRH